MNIIKSTKEIARVSYTVEDGNYTYQGILEYSIKEVPDEKIVDADITKEFNDWMAIMTAAPRVKTKEDIERELAQAEQDKLYYTQQAQKLQTELEAEVKRG